jgi:predicted permease
MKLTLPQSKYADGAAAADFYRRLLDKIQTLPGVEAAAAISRLPLNAAYSSGPLTFEGVTANAERPNLASFEVDHRVITPDYFKTMKTSLLEGRSFTPQDARDKPFVAIIDETLARQLWPGASPLGRRLTFGRFPDKPWGWVEIVGVVKHSRYHKLEGNALEIVYFPHPQYSLSEMTLAIRASSDPLSMVGAARGAVQSLDRDQPIYHIRTMDELMAGALAPARFVWLLLMIFAGVAAVLAMVGIYGVMSRTVTQRAHEIGVRMALGAEAGDVLRLVMGQGMKLTLTGVVIGVVAALMLTGLIRNLLFGVSANDPLTFIAISTLLAGVSLVACWIPARRATKVDPMIALRCE